MSNQNVTLKRIAEIAGVSITTVHRVLNNKEGCSDELKAKILRIAQEEGYSPNYVASSIRKRPFHIALVFPQRIETSRYFLQWMLDGYLNFRANAAKFNVIFQEHYFCDDTDIQMLLKNICNGIPSSYDGVVLYGLELGFKNVTTIHRLLGRGIPVVTLERFPEEIEGMCQVQVDDVTSGHLAAELMAKFTRSSGSVVVVEQPLSHADPNGDAFSDALSARRSDLTVHRLPLPLTDTLQEKALWDYLDALPDLAGIYCTCARHTHAFLNICGKLKYKPQTAIGSEIFTESHAALHCGTLDAVISKRPYTVGYRAIELLFNHLLKNESLPSEEIITPRVILQSNSDVYIARKEHLYGSPR